MNRKIWQPIMLLGMSAFALLGALVLVLSVVLIPSAAIAQDNATPEVPPFVATTTARQALTVDTSEFKKEPPYVIAFAAQGNNNAWGTLMDIQMQVAVDAYGTDVISKYLFADSETNADKQINDMEDLMAQGADAIILTPMGRAQLSRSVDRAMSQGIPVILCASGVDTDNFAAEVGHSVYSMGAAPMEWLAQQMGGKGNIFMLGGIPGVDTAENMLQGARDVLAKYPDIKVLAFQYANWSTSEGRVVTEGMLAANPDTHIDGVWTGGGQQSLGVIEAFEAAGLEIPLLAGLDAQNGFLRLATEKDVKFYAFQYPPQMAETCLDTTIAVLRGEPVQKYIDVYDVLEGVGDFTHEDIDKYYRPEFNDEFIAPVNIPDDLLEDFLIEK